MRADLYGSGAGSLGLLQAINEPKLTAAEGRMMNYSTTHQSLAAFLRYGLGDDAHLTTTRDGDERTVTFRFDDPDGRCSEMAKSFFSGEGAAISDARVLLEVSREVRNTITCAIKTGRWEKANG
jgi:hypothetical protein